MSPFDPCLPCDGDLNPARISQAGGVVVGGGIPLFNGEDGAIGSHPSKANFLSSLQRSLEDSGFAPAGLYGFSREAPAPWYRPELLPTAEAPEGFPEDRAEAWDDYLDGVNMGAFRGGLLGLFVGAGAMLAGLYFGGATTFSPAKSAAAKPAALAAHSRHRSNSSSRKGKKER